nr:hypothetical protein [uncultured Butyrivibrio sp.]
MKERNNGSKLRRWYYMLAASALSVGLMYTSSVTSFATDNDDTELNDGNDGDTGENKGSGTEGSGSGSAGSGEQGGTGGSAGSGEQGGTGGSAGSGEQGSTGGSAGSGEQGSTGGSAGSGEQGGNNGGTTAGSGEQGGSNGGTTAGSGEQGGSNGGTTAGSGEQGGSNGGTTAGSGEQGGSNGGTTAGSGEQGSTGGSANSGAQPGENSTPAPKVTISFDNFTAASTAISDQTTDGTGRLAGYETTVLHYIAAGTNQETTSITFWRSDDSEVALTIDDFDISGIDTDLYDVTFSPEFGMINITKKATSAGTSTGTGSGSESGSGTDSGSTSADTTTTVYYNFQQVTTVATDQSYYFVPYTYEDLDANSAVIGVPQGTAKLSSPSNFTRNNSYAYNQLKAYTNFSGSESDIKVNVHVDQAGTGFDTCSNGSVYQADGIKNSTYTQFEDYMAYWCDAGGAQAFTIPSYGYPNKDYIFGRLYTYTTAQLTAASLQATVNEEQFAGMSTGSFQISDSDVGKYLNMTIDIGEKSYNVGGCTLVDRTLNYRGGDNTISVAFGNTVKTITVDTTGLAKQVWQEDNAAMINAGTVSNNDLASLQRAISEGIANPEVSAEDVAALKDKLNAAIWLKNNNTAISADPDDVNNYDAIVNVNSKYTKVPSNVQAYMGNNFGTNLGTKKTQVTNNVNNAADAFMNAHVKFAGDTNPFADATAANTDQILASEEIYNNLAEVVKRFIDDKYTAQNTGIMGDTVNPCLTYADILGRAKSVKQHADDFVNEFVSILVSNDDENEDDDRLVYDNTNNSNYQQILRGTYAWNNLTEEERLYVNKALNLGRQLNPEAEGADLVTFEKLLDKARAILAANTRHDVIDEAPVYQGEAKEEVVFVKAKKTEKKAVEEPIEEEKEVKTKKTTTASTNKQTGNNEEDLFGFDILHERQNNGQLTNKLTNMYKTFATMAADVANPTAKRATQTFGDGSIVIKVESWLTNLINGTGEWSTSSTKYKVISDSESQISYELENINVLAAACLTNAELYSVNNGGQMEIRLRITPNEEKVSTEHKQQFDETIKTLQEAHSTLTKGEYIDISLEKRFNAGEWQYVPEANNQIKITIDVPSNLKKADRKFFVIRNHDGECTVLDDLDDDNTTLTFETDRFSDYLIVYDDNYSEAVANVAVGTVVVPETVETVENAYNVQNVLYLITIMILLIIFAIIVDSRRKSN